MRNAGAKPFRRRGPYDDGGAKIAVVLVAGHCIKYKGGGGRDGCWPVGDTAHVCRMSILASGTLRRKTPNAVCAHAVGKTPTTRATFISGSIHPAPPASSAPLSLAPPPLSKTGRHCFTPRNQPPSTATLKSSHPYVCIFVWILAFLHPLRNPLLAALNHSHRRCRYRARPRFCRATYGGQKSRI